MIDTLFFSQKNWYWYLSLTFNVFNKNFINCYKSLKNESKSRKNWFNIHVFLGPKLKV